MAERLSLLNQSCKHPKLERADKHLRFSVGWTQHNKEADGLEERGELPAQADSPFRYGRAELGAHPRSDKEKLQPDIAADGQGQDP